jgi:hypothetical protein
MSEKRNTALAGPRSKPLGRRLVRNGLIGAFAGGVILVCYLLALAALNKTHVFHYLAGIYRILAWPTLWLAHKLIEAGLMANENIPAVMFLITAYYLTAGLLAGIILTLIARGVSRLRSVRYGPGAPRNVT